MGLGNSGRIMEGVRRGPPNAVRHHGEEKEEECQDRVQWRAFVVSDEPSRFAETENSMSG
jgi:hypothetical protein